MLAILRGVTHDSLNGVMGAIAGAGLCFAEITLNTPHSLALIRQTIDRGFAGLCLGAGTVLSVDDARASVSAGARFLVAPTFNEHVAAFCRESSIPYFPGALTPSEIERAWNAGACMIKIFPAEKMGPDYFKLVKGPFPDIPLMAVGGVHAGNCAVYLASGASAVAVGGSIFSPGRMQQGQYSLIQKDIEDFLLPVRQFCSNK